MLGLDTVLTTLGGAVSKVFDKGFELEVTGIEAEVANEKAKDSNSKR